MGSFSGGGRLGEERDPAEEEGGAVSAESAESETRSGETSPRSEASLYQVILPLPQRLQTLLLPVHHQEVPTAAPREKSPRREADRESHERHGGEGGGGGVSVTAEKEEGGSKEGTEGRSGDGGGGGGENRTRLDRRT